MTNHGIVGWHFAAYLMIAAVCAVVGFGIGMTINMLLQSHGACEIGKEAACFREWMGVAGTYAAGAMTLMAGALIFIEGRLQRKADERLRRSETVALLKSLANDFNYPAATYDLPAAKVPLDSLSRPEARLGDLDRFSIDLGFVAREIISNFKEDTKYRNSTHFSADMIPNYIVAMTVKLKIMVCALNKSAIDLENGRTIASPILTKVEAAAAADLTEIDDADLGILQQIVG